MGWLKWLAVVYVGFVLLCLLMITWDVEEKDEPS